MSIQQAYNNFIKTDLDKSVFIANKYKGAKVEFWHDGTYTILPFKDCVLNYKSPGIEIDLPWTNDRISRTKIENDFNVALNALEDS